MGFIKFFTQARVVVAAVFLFITLLTIVLGGVSLALFLGLLIYLGTKELLNIIHNKGFNPCYPLIVIINLLFVLFAALGLTDYLLYLLTIGVIATFLIILARGKEASIADSATTIFAFIYSGWLPMHLLLLRSLDINGLNILNYPFKDGLGYIILLVIVNTVSDIAGYYVGTNFGKRPLCPDISPKKTVEGAIGSTVFGVLAALIVGYFIHLELYHALIAGFILVIFAQLGDLVESMFKRDAGIKDSGKMLPGHGGILDRADSYLFTSAIAYYYFKIFVINGISLFS